MDELRKDSTEMDERRVIQRPSRIRKRISTPVALLLIASGLFLTVPRFLERVVTLPFDYRPLYSALTPYIGFSGLGFWPAGVLLAVSGVSILIHRYRRPYNMVVYPFFALIFLTVRFFFDLAESRVAWPYPLYQWLVDRYQVRTCALFTVLAFLAELVLLLAVSLCARKLNARHQKKLKDQHRFTFREVRDWKREMKRAGKLERDAKAESLKVKRMERHHKKKEKQSLKQKREERKKTHVEQKRELDELKKSSPETDEIMFPEIGDIPSMVNLTGGKCDESLTEDVAVAGSSLESAVSENRFEPLLQQPEPEPEPEPAAQTIEPPTVKVETGPEGIKLNPAGMSGFLQGAVEKISRHQAPSTPAERRKTFVEQAVEKNADFVSSGSSFSKPVSDPESEVIKERPKRGTPLNRYRSSFHQMLDATRRNAQTPAKAETPQYRAPESIQPVRSVTQHYSASGTVETPPAETYQAPPQYRAPQPAETYQAPPVQEYQAPQRRAPQPAETYQAPPVQEYQAPQRRAPQPAETYQAPPVQEYQAPQRRAPQPAETYQAPPVQEYQAPQRRAPQPAETYQAPPVQEVPTPPRRAPQPAQNYKVPSEQVEQAPEGDEQDVLERTSGIGGLADKGAWDRQRASYHYPGGDLLVSYPVKGNQIDEGTRIKGERLVETLAQFNVPVELIGIVKGPSITMFEILPAPGVKVNTVANLSDNIQLRLPATHVRIIAPIPGKEAIGVEIPNEQREIVGFREMLPVLNEKEWKVPMILGKNLGGERICIDVAKTPHLLIAGATGSGKSVCVNSLICSILYNRSPREVRLIMVDPKVVELAIYNGIPHLLTPVITDSKRALKALDFCIDEMDRRYKVLQSINARNIEGYNKKLERKKILREKLPYIVLIIDEFADLMQTVGKELEAKVARLTAMSRAVGIHLVLATQRPSTDVITGIIKSNIPTRIAFSVASAIDSRIIIDGGGAEKLLGKGDMLYKDAAKLTPDRIQGAFLGDDEVENVVDFVSEGMEPNYIDEAFFEDEIEDDGEPEEGEEGDPDIPVIREAVEVAIREKKISASLLQRVLSIGFNRASRVVYKMEKMGYIGPQNGSKPREVDVAKLQGVLDSGALDGGFL